MKYKVLIDTEKCKGCGLCVHFCSHGCLEMSKDINERGYHFAVLTADKGEQCKGCLQCAVICPDAVIEIEKIQD